MAYEGLEELIKNVNNSDSTFTEETLKAPKRIAGGFLTELGEAGEFLTGNRIGRGAKQLGQRLQQEAAVTPGFAEAHPIITQAGQAAETVGAMAPYLVGDALLSTVAPEAGAPLAAGTIARGVGLLGKLGRAGALSSKVFPVVAGAASGQRSYEKAVEQGMSSDQALSASMPAALTSAAGMALMGPLGKAGRGILPKAAAAAEGKVVSSALNPSTALRDIGGAVLADTPLMVGTGAAVAAAQQGAGITPDRTPGQIVKDPKEWLSAAMAGGMFGTLHAAQRNIASLQMKGVLTDTRNTDASRRGVVALVAEHIPDPEQRRAWLGQAEARIAAKEPIPIDDSLLQWAAAKVVPEPKEEDIPKTPKEVAAATTELLAKSVEAGKPTTDVLHDAASEDVLQKLTEAAAPHVAAAELQEKVEQYKAQGVMRLPHGEEVSPEVLDALDKDGLTVVPVKPTVASLSDRGSRPVQDWRIVSYEEAERLAAEEAQHENIQEAGRREDAEGQGEAGRRPGPEPVTEPVQEPSADVAAPVAGREGDVPPEIKEAEDAQVQEMRRGETAEAVAPKPLTRAEENKLLKAAKLTGKEIKALTPEERAAKIKEIQDAQRISEAGTLDGGGSPQPEVRGEGRDTSLGGERVQPSRPEEGARSPELKSGEQRQIGDNVWIARQNDKIVVAGYNARGESGVIARAEKVKGRWEVTEVEEGGDKKQVAGWLQSAGLVGKEGVKLSEGEANGREGNNETADSDTSGLRGHGDGREGNGFENMRDADLIDAATRAYHEQGGDAGVTLRVSSKGLPDEVAKLADLFGLKAVLFDVDGGTGPNGFEFGGRVFLNSAHTNAHLAIFGHELTHAIQRLEGESIYKGLERVARANGLKGSAAMGDETLADYIGNKLTQKQFWNRLAKEEPDIFTKVLGIIQDMIAKVRAAFKSGNAGPVLKDCKAIEDAAVDALVRFAKREGLTSDQARKLGGIKDVLKLTPEEFVKETLGRSIEDARRLGSGQAVDTLLKVYDTLKGARGPNFSLHQDPSEAGWEALRDRGSEARYAIVREYLSGRHPAQPWKVVPASQVKKIWQEFSRTGIVRDDKQLDKILDTLVENAERLQFNNEISGHEQYYPDDVLESIFGDSHTDTQREILADWAIDTPERGWRISDYGLPKIQKYLALALEAKSAEEKLTYMDMALNVAHQRSDLASWFIEGGSKTLASISGEGMGHEESSSSTPKFSFFHKTEKLIEDARQERWGSVKELLGWLRGKVSPEEVKQLGLEELTGKPTKKEILDTIKANSVELKDVVLKPKTDWAGEPDPDVMQQDLRNIGYAETDIPPRDDIARLRREWMVGMEQERPGVAQFESYQEPGAKEGSYREMFVTAPEITKNAKPLKDYSVKDMDGYWLVIQPDGNASGIFTTEAEARKSMESRNRLNREAQAEQASWQDGHSQYSDIQNPIVRIRFNEREVDGKRVLFVEEMQGPSDAEQQKMPDYLRKRIYDLGVKRVLQYAKENGFDGVSWTPGEVQAKRYDLSKQVNEIHVSGRTNARTGEKTRAVYIEDKNGQGIHLGVDKEGLVDSSTQAAFQGKSLAEVTGKDMAEKIMHGEQNQSYSGLDLKVGGEGLKRLYDQTLPSLFKKYGGGEVGEADLTHKTGYLADPPQEVNLNDPINLEPPRYETKTLKAPFLPITPETPVDYPKFSLDERPDEQARTVTQVANRVQDNELWKSVKGAAQGLYRTIFPEDRVIDMMKSMASFRPIAQHLDNLKRWKEHKGSYAQGVVRDSAVHYYQHVEPTLKTAQDIENFSKAVTTLTLYQMSASMNEWTPRTWARSGLGRATKMTLEQARAEVRDVLSRLTPEQEAARQKFVKYVQELHQDRQNALEDKIRELSSQEAIDAAREYNRLKTEMTERANEEMQSMDEAMAAARGRALEVELSHLEAQTPQEATSIASDIAALDENKTLKGDYFPLMRFGDHVVRGVLNDGRKYKAQFETRTAAEQDAARVRAEGGEVHYDYESQDQAREEAHAPAAWLNRYRQLLTSRGVSEGKIDSIMNDLTAMWVNTLSQNSIRGRGLKRESVAGYSEDVLRSFMHYTRQTGQAVSNLRYGTKIEQEFREMDNRLNEIAEGSLAPPSDIADMRQAYNQLYNNHITSNTEKINDITKGITKATFMYYLASPATWAVQWAQPFMFTIPKLAVEHGFPASLGVYTRAAKNYIAGRYTDAKIDDFESRTDGLGAKTFKVLEALWSLDSNPLTTREQRAELSKQVDAAYAGLSASDQELLTLSLTARQGIRDLSISHAVFDTMLSEGSLKGQLNARHPDLVKGANKVEELLASPMRSSETGSRTAAAVTAVELARKKGLSYADALEYSRKTITDTLYNFSPDNRAGWMKGNVGRVIGQFQFFRLHTVGKVIQLTKDSIGRDYSARVEAAQREYERNVSIFGLDEAKLVYDKEVKGLKDGRDQARKELAYMTGMGFALAGAAGTPLSILVSNAGTKALWEAMKLVFSDKDDPWDPEQSFENALKEAIGDTGATVFMKGLPALVGWDISRRIGAQGMADFVQGDPPVGVTGTEKANWYAGRLLGPSWGMVTDGVRAMEAAQKGDLGEAAKNSAPKFLKDFAKMYGAANEGVKSGGKTVVKPEDIGPYQMALMMIGINPMEVSLAQEESREIQNLSATLSARRSKLVKDFTTATLHDDIDAREEALQAINTWSQKQPRLKISAQELISAHKTAMDRAAGKPTKREAVVAEMKKGA